MKIFTDFKWLLKTAGIKYTLMSQKVGYRQICVEFTKDSAAISQGRFTGKLMCTLTFTADNYVSILSFNHNLLYSDSGLKKYLSVSIYCFNCEELVRKLRQKGYLSKRDWEKIEAAAVDGYEYVRKYKRSKSSPLNKKTNKKAA